MPTLPQITLETIAIYFVPIVPLVMMVALGVLLKGLKILKETHAEPFNKLILNVTLPALIFTSINTATIAPDMFKGVLVGWILLPTTALAAWGLSKVLRLSRATTGAVILAATWGNTGFLGFPITGALFGAEAVAQSVFYDFCVTGVPIFTMGVIIAERFGTPNTAKKPNPLITMIKTPTLWALVLGMLTKFFALPDAINDVLDMLAQITIPLIMITAGLSFTTKNLLSNTPALLVTACLCLVVAPVVAWFLTDLFAITPLLAQITVLEASMPTAMLVLVFSQRYKLDCQFAAAAICAGLLLSIVTIPLMQIIFFS